MKLNNKTKELINDDNLLQNMGNYSRNTAVSEYAWSKAISVLKI